MADPWDSAPKASPLDVALDAEGASPTVAAVARSIYQQESGSGSNTKTSNAGAVGGMQIKGSTFDSVADKGWNIHDPVDNARAGVRYITQMAQAAGGDPSLTAVGYYGGPGAIAKAKQGVAVSDPRNPGAPNTLQYGQQVAARIPQQQQQQPDQGNWWSQAPVVGQSQPGPNPGGQPTDPSAAPDASAQGDSQGGFWHNLGEGIVSGVQKFGQQFGSDPLGAYGAAARGAADGLTFGLSEKGLAGYRAMSNGTTYDHEIQNVRNEEQAQSGAFGAGQLASAFIPGAGEVSLVNRAVDAVPVASRMAKLAVGAGAGAAEGVGQYAGHTDGPMDAGDALLAGGLGALGGSVAGAINPHTTDQMAQSFANKSSAFAGMQSHVAEVVQDLQGLQQKATQGGVSLGAADANALAKSYTDDAANALRQLPKTQDRQTLLNALNTPRSLDSSGIAALRQLPNGDAVADAIQKRQIATAMTAAVPASNNPILKVGRMAVDNGMLGFLTPHSAIGGFLADLAPVRNTVNALLGGRESRTANIANWLKQGDNANAYLSKFGASPQVQSAQGLAQAAQQTQAAQAAQAAAAQQARANGQAQGIMGRALAAGQAQRQANAAAQAQATGIMQRAQQAGMANRQAQQAMFNQPLQNAQVGAYQKFQAAQAAAEQKAQAEALANQAKVAAQQRQALADQQASDPTYLLGMSNPHGVPRNADQMAEFKAVMENQAKAAEVGPQAPSPVVQVAQQKAAAKAARQQALSQSYAEMGEAVKNGDFSNATFQKPAIVSMMAHNGAASVEDIKPTLQALAAKDPKMAKDIGQLLTHGSDKLDEPAFYRINDALKDAHPVTEAPAVVERTPQAPLSAPGLLSEASGNVQNPIAYKAATSQRIRMAEKAAESAPTPEIGMSIRQLAAEKIQNGKEAIYQSLLKAHPEHEAFLKGQVEPLTHFGVRLK